MRTAVLALPLLTLAAPAAAQSMDHMHMPGMKPKPAAKPKAKAPAKATPKRTAPARGRAASPKATGRAQPAMNGMDMGSAPAPNPHAGHNMADMPGMDMESDAEQAASGQPAPDRSMSSMPGMTTGQQPAADPHAGHDMSMPDMAMGQNGGQTTQPLQGHDMSAMPGMKMDPPGVVKPIIGNAPPPAPPSDYAADRIWGAQAMQGSRDDLRTEQGGQTFSMILFNLAEYQARGGRDGYRWDGEAWYGGDINRFVAKTEGEGAFREGVESAEIQALYSRTIGPYWNVQAGVRYDFKPNPSRTYAVVGIEGLAPNNFDLEGALFLSDKADVLARLDGYYDQRLTQRLILQPRAEFNLSAQDMRAEGYGAGLIDAELGLRLRYEIRREFAPYVGVSWQRQFGDTARFSRARGEDTGGFSFVAGIRTWF